ncbi:MAG: peptidoglycan-binding protein, partial [Clostridia bacterium]|nr:peptidoglycan-binding protein [Clostridia bacterium]
AIKANVMAQISVALNRVYTEFYRSQGYDFDITSSPAYDQTYVYQRDIFSNVAEIVDELFNSYLKRGDNIEPLFAQFCDGVEVSCDGLSQWGSVTLANEGRDYVSILKNYYGEDVDIVTNVPVGNIEGTAPAVNLVEGDTGREIELIQIKLNRISSNFPGIPKIYPVDGFYGAETRRAVEKFQEVFDLTPDGIIGRATWYRIQFIYNAVKRLYDLNSEGLRVNEVSGRFSTTLKEGDSSAGVITLQYYLAYIAQFVPTVSAPTVDGDFGTGTKESVISFQKTYGLEPTGIVNRLTWDTIENTYYEIIAQFPYNFEPGRVLPYPGRVLRLGIEGNDVRALQEYLNYIANTYPEIPKVSVDGIFGAATEAAVNKFKSRFGIEGTDGRVTVQLWNAITSVYEDLYVGNRVSEGQYPGYDI